jgi:hypothetical protein
MSVTAVWYTLTVLIVTPRSLANKSRGGPAMSTSQSPDRHQGTFAEGEADPKKYPEEKDVGTFAEGEADPKKYPEEKDVGTFAEGEADPESYPEEKDVGTFAEA